VLTGELGRTGLQITPLGLGLAALGRPAYINLGREDDLGGDRSVPALRREAYDVLDAAYEAGLRYIDAARSYGLSEEFLAGWLEDRGVAPDALTVGSKWGYTYTGGWRLDAEVNEVKDHTLPALLRQYGESRSLLGRHLDLYQVHSATLESGILEDRDVLSELGRIRADGLVIGVSVSGPRQAEVIRRVLAIEIDGVNPFATVQATWNLLEPSAGPALAEANEAGFGVILKEVFANGRLTARGRGLPAALHELAESHHTTLDRLAMAAALANPWAGVVLSGAVTVSQLESNVEALNLKVGQLEEATLANIAEPPDRYWSERQSLGWQ
jgi:aryl-alcohol dehydrogenase-like predicted oxidoreductase